MIHITTGISRSKGGNGDGFQIAHTGTGNVFRGNRAWCNTDDGFDFFNVLDATNQGAFLIENNWVWENGYNDALVSHSAMELGLS